MVKKVLPIIFSLILLITSLGLPTFAKTSSGRFGLDSAAKKANLAGGQSFSILDIVGGLISNLLKLVGVIFLVLIIYGGVLWMIAGGNDNQVKKAQEIIKNSVIGLIIIIAAYAITEFIVTALN